MHSSGSSSPAQESRNGMHLFNDTTGEVGADEVAIIFSFLHHRDTMCARVCKTWRDAAKKTLVPYTDFRVHSVRSYNAMRIMATALPNLQQLSISNLRRRHIYSNGDDPDEEIAADTANYTTHDINIISSFTKLRILHIDTIFLNGRYPALFDFPLLRHLHINCDFLKWDLNMLRGFPSLKGLELNGTRIGNGNSRLTGNINSLQVLKETIEKVRIVGCHRVEGIFMDLADFPRLKELNLMSSGVKGDIRDISSHDFPALEQLCLPWTVCGGNDDNFQSISDVPSFMQAVHLLMQRTPDLFELFKEDSFSYLYDFNWNLSASSPDWYDREIGRPRPPYNHGSEVPIPPFHLKLVQAGSCLGWVWCSYNDEEYREDDGRYFCEINWLDPEHGSESSDYVTYVEALQRIEERIDFYKGYHQPPTLAEYNRLCEGYPVVLCLDDFAVAVD